MIVSLRLRLLLWLLIPLTVYVGISTRYTYDSAVASADLVQDRALLASARMIAGQVNWQDGAPSVSIPPAALELFASPSHDQVYYQVLMDDDTLLAGRPDVPVTIDFAQTTPSYSTTSFNQQPLRVVSYVRALYDNGTLRMVAVSVGQTMRGHQQLLDDTWQPALHRQLIMLLLAVALVMVGLTIELRPILRVKDELATREPTSLTPLRIGQLQLELRPIVEAINLYIQRLNKQVSEQKRFITDAAHQLRTPLTLIDSQIQFARQLNNQERMPQVLQALQLSSRNMTDLTNKLLQLSQAEASNSATFPRQPVELVALTATVLEELVSLAQRKQIDLGMETTLEESWVMGSETLLSGMLMNLIDNALRYTPEQGKVTISLSNDGQKQVVINVTDNGPGIPVEAREKVFERFYRHGSPDQHGAGLGMAIVKEIVEASQGTITLGTAEPGTGLVVTVALPGCPAPGVFD
ncbi:two-component system sensor histidine kinase TctE [Herbaspirillum sp. Sphag1AN]|uniref:sensor histidine kinase n=1 Tax=unclassified Herbaspirillum TaxID=2624150 RepID=UPI00160C3BF3|nr:MULTISPECIES: sensor histidine kinase [unclassified Herbaspirillum]MBB3211581.1 two-component system sensor histidine kinase TctE [Herbaspirillum sp. Sphag1AN]MBB3245152.1 two-component system sensor histidine kinase TctE [Herbaspirillum sp. Sphag64]